MTDQKQALINIEYKGVVKPFVDATALGLAVGGPTTFLFVNFWDGFVVGSSISLAFYWVSRNVAYFMPAKQQAPRKAGRQINVNDKPWTFDQVATGQFITRQSAFKDFLGFLGWGKQKPAQRNATPAIPKPRWMTEQVFHSHCNGFPVQLSEGNVTQFLLWAYRHRPKGEGLSERSWDRAGKQKGAWYQELPCPQWYHAMMNILYDLQEKSGRDIIVPISHNQIKLAKEPSQILEGLRWLEDQRNK